MENNNNNKIYIGLDPGSHGSLCAFIEDRIEFLPFEDVNYYKVADYLDSCLKAGKVVVAVEEVHSMPRQGVASTFKFGLNVGLLHGILIAKAIPFVTVRPQDWQKSVWVTSDKVFSQKEKKMEDGSVKVTKTVEPKKTSMNAALRLFPKVDLRRNQRCSAPHDGMCDALLICEYARRSNL